MSQSSHHNNIRFRFKGMVSCYTTERFRESVSDRSRTYSKRLIKSNMFEHDAMSPCGYDRRFVSKADHHRLHHVLFLFVHVTIGPTQLHQAKEFTFRCPESHQGESVKGFLYYTCRSSATSATSSSTTITSLSSSSPSPSSSSSSSYHIISYHII